jgi:hypothetical protein
VFLTIARLPQSHSVEISDMPVPFGFGVGDFIAVGGLIAKVVQELKEASSLL